MASDIITSQKDTHYSNAIDELLIEMIKEANEIERLIRAQPSIVAYKYVNEFVPKLGQLYDLTGDFLEIRHPSEKEQHPDIKVREMVRDLSYYLGGINKTNGHTEQINKESIIRGIAMFRAYKKQLQKDGVMVVF